MTPTGDAQFHSGGESGGGRATTSGCWIVNMPPSTSSLAPVNRTLSSIKSPSPTVTHTMLKTPPTSPVTWRILPPPQACCAIRNTPDWCCFTKYYSTCHLEPTGSWWFYVYELCEAMWTRYIVCYARLLSPPVVATKFMWVFKWNAEGDTWRPFNGTAKQSNIQSLIQMKFKKVFCAPCSLYREVFRKKRAKLGWVGGGMVPNMYKTLFLWHIWPF